MMQPLLHLKEGTLYYEVENSGSVILHSEWRDWSLSVARKALKAWAKIVPILESKGTKGIYALIPTGVTQGEKLVKMFGFVKDRELLTGVTVYKYQKEDV